MSRYARRKVSAGGYMDDNEQWYFADDDAPLLPCCEVDDHEAVDTGLIWETGEPILRLPNPIGFGRDEEW
jgi:hypothetical protein